MKEHIIQKQIVQYLKLNKDLVCFSVPNGFWSNIQNTNRKMAYINKLKAEGMMTGVADLIVLMRNRMIFLEVKSETGKQSKSQEIFQDKVTKLGYEYFIVRSIEDVEIIIKKGEKK